MPSAYALVIYMLLLINLTNNQTMRGIQSDRRKSIAAFLASFTALSILILKGN